MKLNNKDGKIRKIKNQETYENNNYFKDFIWEFISVYIFKRLRN